MKFILELTPNPMGDIILNQEQRMNCGVWATMGILLKYGIQFDFERFKDVKAITIPQIENLFKDSGLIEQFVVLNTPTVVDRWLAKGEWVLTKSSMGNFTNPPNVTFDGTTNHFFIIKENLGDRWKCQNSWGSEWGDGGCFYIYKSEFSKLFAPRRIVI